MESATTQFAAHSARALDDGPLQEALSKLSGNFAANRSRAAARLPEFEALRDAAREIKDHTLAHLDLYLEHFEARVLEAGGQVHWCRNAEEARAVILDLCRQAGARSVTKSKSMICEEIAINDHLEANGIEPVETDLGEYIIQLRHETPSHIIAPAIHLNKEQVSDTFRQRHEHLPRDRDLNDPRTMLEEARGVLRQRFLEADVGITGANMLVAETGSVVLVTNEGNADLTHTLPRVHIAVASIEKVVPTLEDATTILRVLARSATGQENSVYTSFVTGPRRADDTCGPEAFHVVLLDNGRSDLLGSEFQDLLRCIRCGACLNHCPVYQSIGGHAYGWVYSGPVGSVLTPALIGIEQAHRLPEASTLCGKCEAVCPMRIPLPRMLRHWRERAFAGKIQPTRSRLALRLWAFAAARPGLYRLASGVALRLLAMVGRRRGRIGWLPGGAGWTAVRDLPAPEGRSFLAQWADGRRAR